LCRWLRLLAAAVYAASGHLLFPRKGELFAKQFDAKRPALGATAACIASPITVNPGVSLASLSASSSGAVPYGKSGMSGAQFFWFDRAGRRMESLGGSDVTGVSNPALSVVDGEAEELLLSDSPGKTPADASPDGQFLLYNASEPGASADLWLLPLVGERASRPFVQTRFDDRDGQFSRRTASGSRTSLPTPAEARSTCGRFRGSEIRSRSRWPAGRSRDGDAAVWSRSMSLRTSG
jgi:hypothetical protein